MPPSVSTTIGLREARRFRKFNIPATAVMHRPRVGERDPLDRALADREAVVLLELGARLRERLIGGEVDDGALQRPRAPERAHLRPEHERAHPLRPEPILRLPNRYFAEFRVPAEFFSPWRCILRALADLPLRRLDPPLGPTAQRLPSQKARLLDHPLFRRVGFLQFALAAFDRQHDRRHPLAKLRMRPQRRHQRLVAQLPDRHPPPPPKSLRPNLPCIGLNRTRRMPKKRKRRGTGPPRGATRVAGPEDAASHATAAPLRPGFASPSARNDGAKG